jgi:uncharacterized protein DUF1016
MAATAPDNYPAFLAELKQRIRGARLTAALSVNKELVLLYWSIGRDTDLRRAFPDMKGVSARNLNYMRAFAKAWPQEEFVQQVAAQLPWGPQ